MKLQVRYGTVMAPSRTGKDKQKLLPEWDRDPSSSASSCSSSSFLRTETRNAFLTRHLKPTFYNRVGFYLHEI